jgi:predicted DNA-binding transcriptional regulator AlpA
MTPTLLRFSDLKKRGIISNWPTLHRWIKFEGFPPGMLLGPNSRAWTDDEVAEWIAKRPSAANRAHDGAEAT